MRIDDPRALAAQTRTVDGAARAAAALEAEVSLAEGRSEEWYDQAADALEDLHRRFPGFHRRDAYGYGPTLSPGARRELSGNDGQRERGHGVATCRGHARRVTLALFGLVLAGLAWLIARHPVKLVLAVAGWAVLLAGHGSLLVFGAVALLVARAARHGLLRPPRARMARPSVPRWGVRR